MATSKKRSGSKKSKSATAVRTRSTSGGGRRGKAAMATPPPDDPLLRHEEADADRIILDYSSDTGTTALVAVAEATPSGASPMRTMAEMRLEAVAATHEMPRHDALAAQLVMPIGESPAGEEIFGVAPMPGLSNWVQLGPAAIPKGQTYGGARVLVTGRITTIAIDPTSPNTVYAGTAQGGVWKTTNAGATWNPMSDNELSLAIGAIAIDPTNPQVVYAGTGEGNFSGDSYYGAGVLKSTNGGNSWTMLANATFVGNRFSRIAITPGTTSRLFAATNTGIFRSTDAGVTWSPLAGGLGAGAATDVCIDPVTPTTVYAAIWGQGIYKTTNAAAATPTWTKLAGGLPATNTFTRVALGISPTSPSTIYALMAGLFNATPSLSYLVKFFLVSTDGGATWTNIALPGGNIGGQGFYNLNCFVDLTTPNVVYLSGVNLWKAVKSGSWTITNVGANIHPDNHAFAMHPANPQIIYAGNDGGIYVSTNAGLTWSDTINKGLCITQFEFVSSYPTSDAIVLGGTQDNGTEQFRNDAVFYHSDDGDGGYAAISQTGVSPNNMLSTYYGNSAKRSTLAGKFGSWMDVASGIAGAGLFYPPMVMDRTASNRVAFGTNQINLDPNQGLGGWPAKIALPGLAAQEFVSAIDYVNATLIYAATTRGKVYVLRNSGSWTASLISASPLPAGPVNDIRAVPGSPNTVILVMGAFSIPHVWRGIVSGSTAAWTSIDGSGSTGIPNIPCDALEIDPTAPATMWVATDVAIYQTTTGGGTWAQFSTGLPNCAVFDLSLQSTARVLRAATHGRGLWEKAIDIPSAPNIDLYFRDHLMSTSRIFPPPYNIPAGFEDPLQFVTLGMPLYWWMCADAKVDSLTNPGPQYQFPVISDVDYLVYETQLQHHNPHRGELNRVYVQVHNRGFQPAPQVTVKALFADASAGLPPLPNDFWTAWPGNGFTQTQWHPIGLAKTLTNVLPTQPAIVEFDWSVTTAQAAHTCLLIIMDSASDPIPAANKVTDIGQLVTREKRVGLKNLQIVTVPPTPSPSPEWYAIDFFPTAGTVKTTIHLEPGPDIGEVSLLFPKAQKFPANVTAAPSRKRAVRSGAATMPNVPPTVAMRKLSAREAATLKAQLGDAASRYDLTQAVSASAGHRGRLGDVTLPATGMRAFINASVTAREQPTWLTIVQEAGGTVVGGNTYVFVKERK